MPTQEKVPMCDALIQKVICGIKLDDGEKSHLAECEKCMNQIIRRLDEEALAKKANDIASESNGHVSHLSAEAQKALEHGRRVFLREFGISFAKDS